MDGAGFDESEIGDGAAGERAILQPPHEVIVGGAVFPNDRGSLPLLVRHQEIDLVARWHAVRGVAFGCGSLAGTKIVDVRSDILGHPRDMLHDFRLVRVLRLHLVKPGADGEHRHLAVHLLDAPAGLSLELADL